MEDATPAPPQKTSTGKIIAFVGCGCLGLVALAVGGALILFFGVLGIIKKSDTYTDTLALIQSDPRAIEALGEPIEVGFWMTGNVSIENGKGESSLSVPVSGPKGSGKFIVEANKPGGSAAWNYTTRELRIDGEDAEVIPLSP